MKINSFEEIKAWQKAKELNVELYRIFKNSKDYILKINLLEPQFQL
jgi:hypothetical protein